MKMIEFNGVWKKYKKGEKLNSLRDAIPSFFRKVLTSQLLQKEEFWALQNINFSVKKGEVVGIIGPNGAGKSTMLKLLSGIIVPNKGSIKITGRISALIEVAAGFHPDLTGRENVYLNGTILGMTRKEIDRKFDRIVDFSGVEEFIDTPVKRYSSGMYARLGFAVAAHVDPDIMLVDEVLAVGDSSFQEKSSQKMRELMESGTTILLVSHNLNLMQNLSKRIILLQKGEVVKEGLTTDVIPFYKQLVHKQQEEELAAHIKKTGEITLVKTNNLVTITNVTVHNETGKSKDSFVFGEPIALQINFNAQQRIDHPKFDFLIRRSDNIVCCKKNTLADKIKIQSINGRGSVYIDLGKINLTAGLYVIQASIWDKDCEEAYALHEKCMFHIESEGVEQTSAIFIPEIKWKIT